VSFTALKDLKAQLQRLWDDGDILASRVAGGAPVFPRQLRLKCPSSAQMSGEFAAVKSWAQSLNTAPDFRIVSRERGAHRLLGANTLPAEAWVDTVEAAVAILGKSADMRRFDALLSLTRARQPALEAWLVKRPRKALEHATDWPKFLDIVAWVQAHPRAGVYLRQIDVPGVHTKFIEANRAVLADLLNAALPSEAIEAVHVGVSGFEPRFGFLEKGVRIRFRPLDPVLSPFPGIASPDLTLDAASFARLNLRACRVFIVENEINFLAFPDVKNSLIIFGSGYGLESLGKAAWLHACELYYWGDLDTHGFAILDELRHHFPNAQSFLMDQATLHAHSAFWTDEKDPVSRGLALLTLEEQTLFGELQGTAKLQRVRLEQELIGYSCLRTVINAIEAGSHQ
jgi:hypothetical protein